MDNADKKESTIKSILGTEENRVFDRHVRDKLKNNDHFWGMYSKLLNHPKDDKWLEAIIKLRMECKDSATAKHGVLQQFDFELNLLGIDTKQLDTIGRDIESNTVETEKEDSKTYSTASPEIDAAYDTLDPQLNPQSEKESPKTYSSMSPEINAAYGSLDFDRPSKVQQSPAAKSSHVFRGHSTGQTESPAPKGPHVYKGHDTEQQAHLSTAAAGGERARVAALHAKWAAEDKAKEEKAKQDAQTEAANKSQKKKTKKSKEDTETRIAELEAENAELKRQLAEKDKTVTDHESRLGKLEESMRKLQYEAAVTEMGIAEVKEQTTEVNKEQAEKEVATFERKKRGVGRLADKIKDKWNTRKKEDSEIAGNMETLEQDCKENADQVVIGKGYWSGGKDRTSKVCQDIEKQLNSKSREEIIEKYARVFNREVAVRLVNQVAEVIIPEYGAVKVDEADKLKPVQDTLTQAGKSVIEKTSEQSQNKHALTEEERKAINISLN